jgi:hypothetical protein
MEIPIAVAVGELSEAVVLKQKQDDLSAAEEELERVLSLSSDFFATLEERDATYAHIQANLSAAYEKPFMKKIALAYAKVKRCADDVAWASDSVVDTTLTPAQVKAQLKQLLEHQRTTLERKMEDRLQAERAEWTRQLKELREEVAAERQHRKAFQAKVKDFSEEIYYYIMVPFGDRRATDVGINILRHDDIHRILGLWQNSSPRDVHGLQDFFIYKRANVPRFPDGVPCNPEHPSISKECQDVYKKRVDAVRQFKPTTFDGSDP